MRTVKKVWYWEYNNQNKDNRQSCVKNNISYGQNHDRGAIIFTLNDNLYQE